MYIRWKLLFGLGTVFWLLLCLSDYLPVRQINTVLTEKEEFIDIKKDVTPKIKYHKPDEGSLESLKLILWNIIAFALTICVCFLLKSMSSRLNIINNHSLLLSPTGRLTVRRTSSSRIPVPISNKSSSTDIHIKGAKVVPDNFGETDWNKSCPNLLRSLDMNQESSAKCDQKMCSIKVMEEHCAKLQEEMINLEATSLKEQANVTKKLEILAKDKKDLTKQYNGLLKENKSLKQQLNEMIDERTLLIKRLECATKEMKTATKNKTATIAKLDEAITNAETLKENLEKIKTDKFILEDKLIILDAEYRRLKEEVDLYRQKESEFERRLVNENKSALLTSMEEHLFNVLTRDDDNEYYVSSSERDIEKVQDKLLSLEKSLESFKLNREHNNNDSEASYVAEVAESTIVQHDEASPSTNLNSKFSGVTLQEQQSGYSICTEPECPLEHRECLNAKCFLKKKPEETKVSPSGDEISPLVQCKDLVITKKQFKVKSTISDDRLSVISESMASTCDDSGDDSAGLKRRIVSHSPAFQKFLRESIDVKYQSKKNIGNFPY